ncbi:hematopoietic SH2 domain-containing protein homolog [Phycodurus eques]|uniref:hematopoietic SH2 domain-containing protein homolog n=1 Tax=Phycodurus eques TaxID=693459 RepID=UPI002ACEBD70|nr:hematopoietic SH2 domain-containing protein homolog [Phycodurus eques]
METQPCVDLHLESSEGGLKELVLRWFVGTQAQRILQNGYFPSWFQGLTRREHAEDLLRDKALGSFLIRLSDKAIGYILSYKGLDRCRHFVISQSQEGLFVISGDCHTYCCITELIEHFKVNPIQPFGEYLTTSCYEPNTGELYDVVNYNSNGKTGVSVHALRSLCDRNIKSSAGNNPLILEQTGDVRTTVQPPALPPKSRNKNLAATLSVDSMSLSQTPAVPKRRVPFAQKSTNKAERLGENITLKTSRTSHFNTDTSHPGGDVAQSQQTPVEGRSKSVPMLHKSKPDRQEETYSNQFNSQSFTNSASQSHAPAKRVTCHTYSHHDPTESLRLSNLLSEEQRDYLELSRSNPLYQTSERPEWSSAPRRATMYAEIQQKPAIVTFPDTTYEQVHSNTTDNQGNTYESLDDMKTKMPKSTWGKNNMKWKKFLPDYMKK